jgi:hypothetical protein
MLTMTAVVSKSPRLRMPVVGSSRVGGPRETENVHEVDRVGLCRAYLKVSLIFSPVCLSLALA